MGNEVLDFGNNGLASMKVNLGLFSFANNPERSNHSLAELLEFVKSQIPLKKFGEKLEC